MTTTELEKAVAALEQLGDRRMVTSLEVVLTLGRAKQHVGSYLPVDGDLARRFSRVCRRLEFKAERLREQELL